jgi:hypothetical protein
VLFILEFYITQILISTISRFGCISGLIKVTDNNDARWKLESLYFKVGMTASSNICYGRTWVSCYCFLPFQQTDSSSALHELFPRLLRTVQGPVFIPEFKSFAFHKMFLLLLRLSGLFKLNILNKSQVFPLCVTTSNAKTFYVLPTPCITDWFL